MSKLKDVADVLTSTNPVPLAVNCAKLAVLLYDVYSTRGSKLEEFARCFCPQLIRQVHPGSHAYIRLV